MTTHRYYLSPSPGTFSPPLSELRSIEAESPAAAIAKLKASSDLPADWPTVWAHLLVWNSRDEQHIGFESTRIRGD